jgi:dihydrofolate synthase/folylpolyglutamate synthase
MNYEEAREYIRTLYEEKRIILGLERVTALMSLVGNPQKDYPCAIITGTNGKGSTATYLSAILKSAGFKVGTNLSPHVQDITERFLVNLEQINHQHFADLTSVFKDVIVEKWPKGVERPTFHELMTAMAFYLFSEEKVDYAIMEVGMGGRYDASNIIENKLSIFTPIHYDHCRYLGDSLQAIAQEKAHIMKAGGVAVSAPQSPQVRKVISDVARKFSVHLQFLDIKRFTRLEGELLEPVKFRYKFSDSIQDDLCLSMNGQYQIYNASLAILAAEKIAELDIINGFAKKFDRDVVSRGLNLVISRHLPGRLEIVGTNPAVIIDGSHNVHGIRNFMNELKAYKLNGKIILVMGFKDGKNYYDVLPLLNHSFDKIIFTNFEKQGGVQPEELKCEFEKINSDFKPVVETVDDPVTALDKAYDDIDDSSKDIIAIAGSLYLAGEIKNRYADKFNVDTIDEKINRT